jgi:HlyD family secretion protein
MKRFSVLSMVILLGASLLISACSGSPGAAAQAAEGETTPTPTKEVTIPVEVAIAETGDIDLVFAYSGSIQPKDEVNLMPGANGRIEEVLVEVGDQVKAGDPIAVIEDDTYLAQIKQAQAALRNAQLNLAKIEQGSRPEEIIAARAAVELARAALNDVASVSDDERTKAAAELARTQTELRRAQSEYDKIAWAGDVGTTPQAAALEQATINYENALADYNLDTTPGDSVLAPLMLQLAQAELNLALKLEPYRPIDVELAKNTITQAEAALELIEIQLDETVIKAPFDGIVAGLPISQGSRVGPQGSVARLISAEIEAVVEVQESLISQVRKDQSASLTVTAYPGQNFPGVVTSVAPSADTNTRTFEVKVTPTKGAELLRSGMFAEVSILAQQKHNTTLVPRAAVIQDTDPPTVYVISEDNLAEQREVTTGLFDSNRIEILSGVKPGEVVVIAGQPNLIDGIKVEVADDPRIAE